MDNALLVNLSKQVALHREMDIIANNLANLNTTAFKGEGLRFEQHLASAARAPNAKTGDQKIAFVKDAGLVRDLSEGPLKQTGGDLDVAIRGEGYFVVDTPSGERYTRDGAFVINKDGMLVNAQGYRVRGQNGPIQFDQDDSQVVISHDGTVSTMNNNQDAIRGKIRLVRFDNPGALRNEGSGLFSAATQPKAVTETTSVVQGSLEQSNVKPILEMSHMIEVMRAYSSLTNMMTSTNDLRKTAIDKLADVSS